MHYLDLARFVDSIYFFLAYDLNADRVSTSASVAEHMNILKSDM